MYNIIASAHAIRLKIKLRIYMYPGMTIFNPRRACAVRVTVVCVSGRG